MFGFARRRPSGGYPSAWVGIKERPMELAVVDARWWCARRWLSGFAC